MENFSYNAPGVIKLELEEMKIKLAVMDEKICELEEGQKRQNIAIERVEKKLENIQHWILAVLTGVIINLAIRFFAM
ncbi:MAG: hypothetical protein HPY81_06750 [Firmicutes bacterium]|nr:hypothetical protein [Bacillota bacterium]